MPRKLLILAATIVGAHLAVALTLGVSPSGTLLANLLEISASVLAAVMSFGASRRARGMARWFKKYEKPLTIQSTRNKGEFWY